MICEYRHCTDVDVCDSCSLQLHWKGLLNYLLFKRQFPITLCMMKVFRLLHRRLGCQVCKHCHTESTKSAVALGSELTELENAR